MTTYEKIKDLCVKAGFPISKIADHIPGLSINKASITGWKNGSVPRPDKIKTIADYFGVSVEYLTRDDAPKNAFNTVNGNNNIIGNGNTVNDTLTEQEKALIDIFEKLDVVKQAQLLAYAAELAK